MTDLTRRSFLRQTAMTAGALALPGHALVNHAFVDSAWAATPPASMQGPGVYRYRLGDIQLTALYDGTWFFPFDGRLVRNASNAAVNRALAAAFLPPNVLPITITALLVNTGKKLVLIDTGSAGQIVDSAGFMNDNLAAAGVKPADIDVILISHFHPDHINGIKSKDGAGIFPNAEIFVPEPELRFWMDDGNQSRASGTVLRYFRNARRIFRDIEKELHVFRPGAEVVPGIVSVPAYGHTPGHTAFAVHSGPRQMMVMGDAARNPYLFVRHPEWQPSFDMDGALAATTRRRMLDRASADRMLVEATHFPFPACGHISKTRGGYELTPTMWAPL
jgi:glyoxylase-like metal-dependent hydrolase (beta-lactamase superfamily II)